MWWSWEGQSLPAFAIFKHQSFVVYVVSNCRQYCKYAFYKHCVKAVVIWGAKNSIREFIQTADYSLANFVNLLAANVIIV